MRYVQLISKIEHFTYRDFHELYSNVKYDLEILAQLAEDRGESSEFHFELIRRLYSVASGLLSQLHEEDDEYGTNVYCGAPVNYEDCAYQLIGYVYQFWHAEIDAVLYDGKVNSVRLIGLDVKSLEQHQRELENVDEDLPF